MSRAVDQLQKLLDEVNRMEGYDRSALRFPQVAPYCKRHRRAYVEGVGRFLACPECRLEVGAGTTGGRPGM